MNSWTQKTFTEAIQCPFWAFELKTEEKNIVYIFFSVNIETTNIFVAISTPKTIFKVSQTEGEKENLNREIFFLAIRRERKEEKSSTVNLELTIRKMDQPGKALRMKNEFSSTTTASKGPHDY